LGGLPLLYGQRLIIRNAQPHHLALCVKSIEIDMGDDS
jgi:hypothetical protein